MNLQRLKVSVAAWACVEETGLSGRVMKELIERIESEALYLGNGIVKADGFINHQLDPVLTAGMGEAFAERFAAAGVTGITRVVTAEVSGIAPALAVSQVLGVPMVFARKKPPVTMTDELLTAEAPSHTKGGVVKLYISSRYLAAEDRVLLIDDFLATGHTVAALARLIGDCGATLCGIGCVIEKVFENGRDRLSGLSMPVVTLAKIDLVDDRMKVY